MEKKNEMTEMEVGDEDWFACWKYHQHDGDMSIGLQQRIWNKMKEHREHYTAEQHLAVAVKMFMELLKQRDTVIKAYEKNIDTFHSENMAKIEDLEYEITELKSKLDTAQQKVKDLLDILC